MRFNSVLGAFLFIILASFLAFVIFIQTSSFGSLVTRVISDISERKAQTKVSIKSIGISLFPPGIEFNRVRVNKVLGPQSVFNSEFGKLGFYISLIEVEEKKLTFGEIRVEDSVIDVTYPEDVNDPPLTEIDRKIIDKVFDLTEKTPVRVDTFLFHNARIFANHDLLEARRLKVFKKGKSFMTRFHLSNLKPLKDEDFSIDEIWGEAEIGKKDITIHRLRIQHDVDTLLVKGEIKDYPRLKKARADLKGEATIYFNGLKDIVPLPELIDFESGSSHFVFNLSMLEEKYKGLISGSIRNLRSNIAFADSIEFSTEISQSKLLLNMLDFKYEDQSLKLLKPSVIADFDKKLYLHDKITAQVQKVSLNNALRILGPSLTPLKGKLTGIVDFNYKEGDYYFTPHKDFVVNDLGLVVGARKFTVLMIKKATLNESHFNVINKEFQMSSLITLANSKLDVDGFINSKHLKFSALTSKVDFQDFGNISKLDIKGRGTIDINVQGPLSDTVIRLKGKSKGFEVLGYQLGEADKDISIDLKDSSVIIDKFESQYSSTHLSGTGAINYDNSDINLGINSQQASFHDLSEILKPIFSKLDFLPEDLDFSAKIDTSIYGKTNLTDLKVKSKVKFTDLTAYKENFSGGEFNVGLSEQVVSISEFSADKGKGQITGNFSFNLLKDRMKLDFNWHDIFISSFHLAKVLNFNLDARLGGTIKGEGTTKDYHFDLIGSMTDAKAQNYKFEDSKFDLNIYPSRIEGRANLLGKMFDSSFDIALTESRQSHIKLDVVVPNVKPVAVAILGQQLESQEFDGKIIMKMDSKFHGKFENLTMEASLNQLNFNHTNFKVNYISDKPEFVVDSGKIVKWNLNIKESDLFLVTKGEGTFGKNVSLIHELHFNSKILEILIPPILSSEGFIRNIIRINGDNKDYELGVSSKTNDLDLSIEGVPFPVNDLSYSIDYSSNRLLVNEVIAHLDNGSIAFKGDVFFDENEPDVNIKFSLDRAEIPILGKSLINLSGQGIILGNEMPYNLGGEIIVNKAQIVNELNEFNSKSGNMGQIRFLPKNQESAFGKIFNLNVNVKADNPIKISNSMMDVALKGELNILGNPARPRGEGHLYSPLNTSRVFFKNSEYFISNADLTFSPKKEISNPDFDIQAVTFISTYKVFAKAYGDLDRFTFDLTSDPNLPRNSILSLIAFGYTNKIQNTLEAKDQQSLTQVGVGSFVFDQFKISDILKKQFGLQINLGTVLEQSQTDSLLSGRSQGEGQGQTLGRTRSATKIELKKRLDEALTLSVSSTMGGSIGQRQSMNLNYGLSKKVQLEGVYELRTNEEGQEDIISNSIGGDLKFRWTFK